MDAVVHVRERRMKTSSAVELFFRVLIGLLVGLVMAQGTTSPCVSREPCFDRNVQTQITLEEGDFAVLECRIYNLIEGGAVTWHGPKWKDLPLAIDEDMFLNDKGNRFSVELVRSPGDTAATPNMLSRLVIDYTEPSDSGYYTCTATGIHHVFTYKLTVKRSKLRDYEATDYGSGRFVLIHAPPYVKKGGEALLKCRALVTAMYQNSKFSVDWYRDGRPVVTRWPRIRISKSFEAHRIVVDQQGTKSEPLTELAVELKITNASLWKDAGIYECRTSHMEGYQKKVSDEHMQRYHLRVLLRRKDFLLQTTTTPRPTRRPSRRPYMREVDDSDWWNPRDLNQQNQQQLQTQNDGSSASQVAKSREDAARSRSANDRNNDRKTSDSRKSAESANRQCSVLFVLTCLVAVVSINRTDR